MTGFDWTALDERLQRIHKEGEARLGCCYRYAPTDSTVWLDWRLRSFGVGVWVNLTRSFVGPCRKCGRHKPNGRFYGLRLSWHAGRELREGQ